MRPDSTTLPSRRTMARVELTLSWLGRLSRRPLGLVPRVEAQLQCFHGTCHEREQHADPNGQAETQPGNAHWGALLEKHESKSNPTKRNALRSLDKAAPPPSENTAELQGNYQANAASQRAPEEFVRKTNIWSRNTVTTRQRKLRKQLSLSEKQVGPTSATHTHPPVINQETTVTHDAQSEIIFLRDSCPCPLCVDPHSGQKNFQTSHIPLDIEAISSDTDTHKVISWKNDVPGFPDDHVTRIPLSWLSSHAIKEAELKARLPANTARIPWDKRIMNEVKLFLPYEAYITSDAILWTALRHLNQYGLVFLQGVPESEEAVIRVASRIGTLKDTFYGRTWDVRSVPEAKNVAYTPKFLGFHMDLLYTTNPPHLQLLHSLRARAPGGESLFTDAFNALRALAQRNDRELWKTLTKFRATYHYTKDDQSYLRRRPIMEMKTVPQSLADRPLEEHLPWVKDIAWSPPFQGPFQQKARGIRGSSGGASLTDYLRVAKLFDEVVQQEENIFEYRLKEGECVIFDNRRVLHARREFDATQGERWLKGAYLDDDVYWSKYKVLEERFTEKGNPNVAD